MLKFKLDFSERAFENLKLLAFDPAQQIAYKAVIKALKLMETNLKHPSLNTHIFYGLKGQAGEKVFESYAQNKTSGAYRMFWHYGPSKNELTILAIIPHPDFH